MPCSVIIEPALYSCEGHGDSGHSAIRFQGWITFTYFGFNQSSCFPWPNRIKVHHLFLRRHYMRNVCVSKKKKETF
ncbi:unnamed protein product [Brassica rapa subsp. trilocularis]